MTQSGHSTKTDFAVERGHDSRDGAPRLQGGFNAAAWSDLRFAVFLFQRTSRARRSDREAGESRSAHARAAEPDRGRARGEAPGGSEDAAHDRRRRGLHRKRRCRKAVKLAELLGMPVTQMRQIYANFPETHPAIRWFQ